jgi:tellurite resistance protein
VRPTSAPSPEPEYQAPPTNEDGEIVDAEIVDAPAQSAAPTAGPGDATQKQLGMIAKLFKDKGFPDDKDIRHNYVVAIIKRQFESTKELTKREASNVIESLMAESQEAEQFDDEEAPY